MEKSVLIDAGLTQKESEIYILLLKKGSCPASDIARSTNISRPHVYDTLETLIDKGLVSYVIIDGRRNFKPAPPESLLNYLEDEKQELASKENKIRSIIPSLEKLIRPKIDQATAEIYQGKEGLKSLFKDIIVEKKNFVAFGASEKFQMIMPLFSKKFIKERQKFKIKGKLVVVEGVHPIKTRLNNYRWIPKEYSSPSTTVVYGNKVAIILWNEPYIGILISSAETARSYRNYFELLWGIAKKDLNNNLK
jgi:sugar-specific transcriptional regulator TrmB